MTYNKLIIHPLGDDTMLIQETIKKFGGIFRNKPLLGVPMIMGMFEDSKRAALCMDELKEMDCVSHVDWAENA